MHNLHGPALIAVAALTVILWLMAFVAFWALTGWGVSIAMRAYRWGMRGHDQARELRELEALDYTPAQRSSR